MMRVWFHFKSDNCAQEYKLKDVFANWNNLAQENNKTLSVYCGISGDGKNLVDSMSSFRVKAPVWKSIVNEIFFFNNVEQVKIHFEQKHVDKPNWLYKIVSIDELEELRIDKRKAFEITGCEKIHMIAFSHMDKFLQSKTFVAVITALSEILLSNFNLQNREMQSDEWYYNRYHYCGNWLLLNVSKMKSLEIHSFLI